MALGSDVSRLSTSAANAAAQGLSIVVPLYNEAAGLEQSVRRLHRFLTDGFPFRWRIVIVSSTSPWSSRWGS